MYVRALLYVHVTVAPLLLRFVPYSCPFCAHVQSGASICLKRGRNAQSLRAMSAMNLLTGPLLQRVKASSVLHGSSEFSAKHAFDYAPDSATCWNSEQVRQIDDPSPLISLNFNNFNSSICYLRCLCVFSAQGSPQHLLIEFSRPVRPLRLELEFQGGFVGQVSISALWKLNAFISAIIYYLEYGGRSRRFRIEPRGSGSTRGSCGHKCTTIFRT